MLGCVIGILIVQEYICVFGYIVFVFDDIVWWLILFGVLKMLLYVNVVEFVCFMLWLVDGIDFFFVFVDILCCWLGVGMDLLMVVLVFDFDLFVYWGFDCGVWLLNKIGMIFCVCVDIGIVMLFICWIVYVVLVNWDWGVDGCGFVLVVMCCIGEGIYVVFVD